ncbi:MAG: S-layer homology domain-containing protein [Oscillospiraceae bacterium]|jgi:hypothetical protein|nr:S-layer homology domain-containing protein [Oscillospiraceae bacterium]
MQKRFFRKLAAMAVTAVFTVSLLPAALSASVSDFKDVAGHWGESHLGKMIEAGVIAGDGKGNAMPDKRIERYEAAIMLSKIFGLNNLTLADAVTGNYTDITAASPYVEEYINNIIAAGFMVGGAGKFEPNRDIPREEAFTALRNAFRIPDAPEAYESSFPDFEDVSDWAEGHILAMEAAGMIAGKNGKIAPNDTITRAEFAALLSKGVGMFIDAEFDFEGAEHERAIVRNPGLTLENLTIEVLTIAQGVGDGDVTLENCDIGVLFIRGGGENSIHLINSNVTEMIIDTAVTGNVRIVIDETSLVEMVRIYSEGAVLDNEGTVLEVEDHTGGNGGENGGGNGGEEGEDKNGTAAVRTVHESVNADVSAEGNAISVTLTGELNYQDNLFLPAAAADFEAVVDEDGRPLAAVLAGAFTAIEINVKEILAAAGFGNVDIVQTNLALSAYAQDGGSKIDQPANIVEEDGGVWVKRTFDRDHTLFDDGFNVLILGGEIAVLVFTDAETGDEITITIDAAGLVLNGFAADEPEED